MANSAIMNAKPKSGAMRWKEATMQPSEMTNEKILSLAELCFFEDHSVEEDQQTAAVLRDYVRIRRQIAELRDKLKVADDALRKLQERLVAGVYDGTIDPHEALKIAEDALAAIREKGGVK